MKTGNVKNYSYFISLFLINVISIYISYIIFPSFVVLGNSYLSAWIAVLLNSFLLMLFFLLVRQISNKQSVKIISYKRWVYENILSNIVGIWLLSKIAVYSGLGISSFLVAILLGIVISSPQYFLSKNILGKLR